jgi:hypothetical protein
MNSPTPDQEKFMRDIAARTLRTPSVVPPGGIKTPNPGFAIKWREGEVIVSPSEKQELDAISQAMGQPAKDWMNANC